LDCREIILSLMICPSMTKHLRIAWNPRFLAHEETAVRTGPDHSTWQALKVLCLSGLMHGTCAQLVPCSNAWSSANSYNDRGNLIDCPHSITHAVHSSVEARIDFYTILEAARNTLTTLTSYKVFLRIGISDNRLLGPLHSLESFYCIFINSAASISPFFWNKFILLSIISEQSPIDVTKTKTKI
jgi:hypothetical protein